MGPPSEKGGIAAEGGAEGSLFGLQWGRPPRRAESLTQQNELLVAAMASMGPPSEKGGIFHGACGHRRGAFDASMGPPSEKGGI